MTHGYAVDPQKLLDEIVRLEALVVTLTGERDRARDLAIRSGAFQGLSSNPGMDLDDLQERPSVYDMFSDGLVTEWRLP
jgi:hypothetical protein